MNIFGDVRAGAVTLLTAPSDIEDRASFDAWQARVQPGLEGLRGHIGTRTFQLASEQLLPHRAARAESRFVALSEFTHAAATAPLVAAAGEATGGGAFSVFELIFETTTAPDLPPGVERPRREVPEGPPGIFMAYTRPVSSEADAAYNEWYDRFHLPETLHLQDFRRGRRFRRLPEATEALALADVPTPYLTVYDVANVGAVPFARESLTWLVSVSVDHLGPESYDRAFTQAFIFEQLRLSRGEAAGAGSAALSPASPG